MAALVTATLTVLPGSAPKVEAGAPKPLAKADRPKADPIGRDCSQQIWPNFEAACLRGSDTIVRLARVVEMVRRHAALQQTSESAAMDQRVDQAELRADLAVGRTGDKIGRSKIRAAKAQLAGAKRETRRNLRVGSPIDQPSADSYSNRPSTFGG